jgi:hypothetical protein
VEATVFELVLVNGESRRLLLPSHSGEVASALDRLETWIKTADGGWVQKSHVVEARIVEVRPEATEELTDLDAAAGQLADQR